MKRYRTIVADPPWHYDGTGWDPGDSDHRRKSDAPSRGVARVTGLPYASMSVEEIAALPVGNLAGRDAHLYLWTTHAYYMDARAIAAEWGFRVVKHVTWCKAPAGFALGGVWGSASEFVLFCRRGHLKALTKVSRDWFEWPRSAHSQKPEAFLDLVEQVSPGPYVELFARRDRLGWDTWGNESLGTAEVAA